MPSIVSFRGDTGLSSIRWIKLSVAAHAPPRPVISSRRAGAVDSVIHRPGCVSLWALCGVRAGHLRGIFSGRMDFVYSNKSGEKFSSLFLKSSEFILLEVSIPFAKPDPLEKPCNDGSAHRLHSYLLLTTALACNVMA